MENSYAESGMKRLAMEALTGKVPSGSWVRSMAEMEETPRPTTADVVSYRLFNLPVMDAHKISMYDAKVEPFLRRGKHERGTSTFEAYNTLQCVEEGKRMQIACGASSRTTKT